MEVGAFFRESRAKPMLQARRFMRCTSLEKFRPATPCTSGASNGCYEINSPTDRGLCRRKRSRSSPTPSRADFPMAGINSPLTGHQAGLRWRYSSPFPIYRARSDYHSFRSIAIPRVFSFGGVPKRRRLKAMLTRIIGSLFRPPLPGRAHASISLGHVSGPNF